MLLFSCSKSEILTLSRHNVEFTSVGGEQEIVVNANTKWEVKSDADWLSTGIRAKGDGTIVIYAQPNYSTDERNAKISVITLNDGIFEEITISQKGESPFQVYNEDSTPFTGNMDLVGIPYHTFGSFDSPGGFPSSTSSVPDCPWEVTGEIENGIMTIDFPDSDFSLTSEYTCFTEGLIVGQIFIEQKNNTWVKIGLHKKEDRFDNQAYVLYVADDFSNELVTFKPGWNFVEIVPNPDWVYGNGEPQKLIGTISQNINDFLKKGYRWQIEHWVGPF